jgi:predicted transcriptional regulator of viral defense system
LKVHEPVCAFSFKFDKVSFVPADRTTLRNRLTELASTQSGYFTAAQARERGYSYSQQSFHTGRGNWLRVERNLYRLPHWPIGLHDDLVRAALWSQQRAVVSHESAARVHGLGEIDPLRTHVTVPPGFRGRMVEDQVWPARRPISISSAGRCTPPSSVTW